MQMTMVTVADTGRSPTNSIHSRISYRDQVRNGESFEMEKCLNGSMKSSGVGGPGGDASISPSHRGGYCMIPSSSDMH